MGLGRKIKKSNKSIKQSAKKNFSKKNIKKQFSKRNMKQFGRNVGGFAIDGAGTFISNIPGIGPLAAPLLAPVVSTLSAGVRSGHVGREFKRLTPKRYFNKLALGGIPALNKIPGMNSIQQGIIQSTVHGNGKYLKSAAKNYPKTATREYLTGKAMGAAKSSMRRT